MQQDERIRTVPLHEEVKGSFLDYAMSVIVKGITDVRTP